MVRRPKPKLEDCRGLWWSSQYRIQVVTFHVAGSVSVSSIIYITTSLSEVKQPLPMHVEHSKVW